MILNDWVGSQGDDCEAPGGVRYAVEFGRGLSYVDGRAAVNEAGRSCRPATIAPMLCLKPWETPAPFGRVLNRARGP